MSDYGLRIRDALGNIILNITDRITRLRYLTIVPASTSDSITLDDLAGLTTVELSFPINVLYANQFESQVTRSSNTINWTASGGGTPPDSIIIVFIYS